MTQQLSGIDAFKPHVAWWKMFTDIPQRRSAKQSIAYRMQQYIGVRMTIQTLFKLNIHAADNAFSANN
jgi:hypothetical protein